MPYIELTDFVKGLDARKGPLTGPPGSLVTASNGHITPAGEFEKRKLFARLSPALGGGISTFGYLALATGIFTFGSDDPAGGTMPAGHFYQRLQHPAVLAGIAYDPAKHAMAAVVWAEAFGGKAFVIASFADGGVYVYYDGAIVSDFVGGFILDYLAGNTSANRVLIAAHLVGLLNETSQYPGTQLPNPNDNEFYVEGLPGIDFSLSAAVTSAGGVITISRDRNPVPGVPGTAAAGQFRIVAGGENAQGQGTLTSDTVVPANGDTVTIGGKTYTLVTALSAVEGQVLRGAASNTALTNLIAAINHTGTPNTDYFCAAAHPSVRAGSLAVNAFTVTAIVGGTVGNAIATTETSAHLAWGGGTMAGGTDVNLISSVKVAGLELLGANVNWSLSNSLTASAVATGINLRTGTTGYTATSNVDVVVVSAAAVGSAPNGRNLSVNSAGNLVTGDCLVTLSVTGTGTAFSVDKVLANGLDILGGAVALGAGGLSAQVTAIAAGINAHTTAATAHGYLAFASGANLYIGKALMTSTDPDINIFMQTTGDGGTVVGQTPVDTGIDLTVAAAPAAPRLFVPRGTTFVVTPEVTATPTENPAQTPFVYQWQEETMGSANGFTIVSPNSAVTKFSIHITSTRPPGRFRCLVTDALGHSAYSNTVVLALSNT